MMRRFYSIKNELLQKSREAMINAVQTFNNPSITFKSEHFIVLSTIAWTYLLHAYYKKVGVDYRSIDKDRSTEKRRVFKKTAYGEPLLWSLEECIQYRQSPLKKDIIANLQLLTSIRHEIEHRMTTRIDDGLGAYFQANALAYNSTIKQIFGSDQGIDDRLSFSIQFVGISEPQADIIRDHSDLPKHISALIYSQKSSLDESVLSSPNFSYSILFTRKTVNHPNQADVAYHFIEESSETSQSINQNYVYKEKEKPKYAVKDIIQIMRDKGYDKFGVGDHTRLWQKRNAKNPTNGIQLLSQWFWYNNWVMEVEEYCRRNASKYKSV